MTVDKMIDDIIKKEGGYINHRNDRGGPTNYGITLNTLSKWRGVECGADDVRKLRKSEARHIYSANYYTRPGLVRLPVIVQPIVFDMAVNHGPKNAVIMLQDVLVSFGYHVGKIDGIIGNRTVAAAEKATADLGTALIDAIVNRRIGFYERLCKLDETQRAFLPGWIARAESFLSDRAQA